jgi:L-alanine-DL-glutamate epimerase-like enolase superfamily enzyme
VVSAAQRARAAGYRVYLASKLEGALGIATALHAAAVIKPDYACGLATLGLFARPDPLPASVGRIAVPSGPGLGDGLLAWYDL